MTVLVGCLSCILAAVLASFTIHTSSVAATKAHAQVAADAAALAAVAESGPYGGGDPAVAARTFAARNGAAVESCICPRGATAMQVEVSVEGITARARAVIEPDLLRPATSAMTIAGLNPVLKNSVEELVARSSGAVWIVSGYRSVEEQQILWADALRRYGSAEAADDWVAPPGHSMHERGLAVDLGGDLDLAVRLAAQFDLPLYRPLDNEPWHFELIGSRS